MGVTLLKLLWQELKTVRVYCKKCQAIIEVPTAELALLEKVFALEFVVPVNKEGGCE